MERGAQRQNIIVIPDSGTGELAGLTGSMTIVIAEGGAHSYEFDYRLPDATP
jgi:beta-phosphoglucomutase-like phosphatase (HAD superfamily)